MPAPCPQRWNPVGGFCEKLLPSDRWPWSDVSGLQHRPLDGVALPSPHWEWESDWYVDENFGGEPTEKGVGELGCCRGSDVCGGDALGSAHPLNAVSRARPILWHQPWPVPCMLPTFCKGSVGVSAVPPSACSPPSPALPLPSARASQSTLLHLRGGHTPSTSLPPTQETRSGTRACGGGGGSGTGDTSPGTPGPRLAPTCGLGHGAGPTAVPCCEDYADPHFCPPTCAQGTPPPCWDLAFDLSSRNTVALHAPSSGRRPHGGSGGQTGPGQHRTCPDPGLGLPCPRVRLSLGTASSPQISHAGPFIVFVAQTDLPA